MGEADGEPDAHAGDGAEDGGQDQEELEWLASCLSQSARSWPSGMRMALRSAIGR